MEGGDTNIIAVVPKKKSCLEKTKEIVKRKCDCKAAQDTLLFNFFAAFYYETSLELLVSSFSALPHSIKPANYIETWSAVLAWFFMVTNGIFLLGLIWFMLVGSAPELRLNRY